MTKAARNRNSGKGAPKGHFRNLSLGLFSSSLIRYSSLALALLTASARPVFGQSVLGEPEERVIHYETSDGLADPVALLEKRLAARTARLTFDHDRGYLRSLLAALGIPVSSQGLVFSRTSSQREHTSPHTPRAVYFADNVSVGWVPGGPVIDLVSVDPTRGAIFYTLEQSRDSPPRFTRRADCRQCLLGPKTLNVPGFLVRSVYTSSDGTPLSTVDGFVNGHNSPLKERWGGWYVTGTATGDVHLGNLFVTNLQQPGRIGFPAPTRQKGITDLKDRFDTSRYLSPHSDLVALLVLEHEVRMHNLITRANYETRYALDQQTTPGTESGN